MPLQTKRIYTTHEQWLSLIFDKMNDIDSSAVSKAILAVDKHYFARYDARTCTSFEVIE
jgi:hypothetical protein